MCSYYKIIFFTEDDKSAVFQSEYKDIYIKAEVENVPKRKRQKTAKVKRKKKMDAVKDYDSDEPIAELLKKNVFSDDQDKGDCGVNTNSGPVSQGMYVEEEYA
jgi:hypothetical protein